MLVGMQQAQFSSSRQSAQDVPHGTNEQEGQTARWKMNIVETIEPNSQRMLDSREYRTPMLDLARDWGSTPVILGLSHKLRDHLHFPEIHNREQRIPQASAETFNWVFTSSCEDEQARTGINGMSFRDWLLHGDGVYWITGKAGSGKSTLLKFLHRDPRTANLLNTWSGKRILISARFFFWNSGSQIQKSNEGLIRLLLSQCLDQLEQHRMSISLPLLEPSRWDAFAMSTKFDQPWDWPHLVEAFHIFLEQCSKENINYFFLIDSLDEFDGPSQDLIDLLNLLAALPNVKLCVSSRPWVAFEDAYRQKPSLRVEDMTRLDISSYVSDKFKRQPAFTEIEKVNPQFCRGIIDQVTTKASGVFLWVVLVVKSLTEGLANGDRAGDLQRRLDDIPAELENLFAKMLNGLDNRYYICASELFQIFRAAKKPLSLLCMSFANEEDASFAFSRETEPLEQKERNYRAMTMKRRLNACCMGLLEIHSPLPDGQTGDGINDITSQFDGMYDLDSTTSVATWLSDAKVEYLHRTAKDWLYGSEVWKQIMSATPDSFNPAGCLARSYLLLLKTLTPGRFSRAEDGFWDLLIWCTEYAIEAGRADPAFHVAILDEMDRAAIYLSRVPDGDGRCYIQRFWSVSNSLEGVHWASTVAGWHRGQTFLDFAVRCQLVQYLEQKIPSLAPAQCALLLDTARRGFRFSPALGSAPSCCHTTMNEDIARLLIRHGANEPKVSLRPITSNNPEDVSSSVHARHHKKPLFKKPLLAQKTNGWKERAKRRVFSFLRTSSFSSPKEVVESSIGAVGDTEDDAVIVGSQYLGYGPSGYDSAAIYRFKMHDDDEDTE